jgi:hypothetical protein
VVIFMTCILYRRVAVARSNSESADGLSACRCAILSILRPRSVSIFSIYFSGIFIVVIFVLVFPVVLRCVIRLILLLREKRLPTDSGSSVGGA